MLERKIRLSVDKFACPAVGEGIDSTKMHGGCGSSDMKTKARRGSNQSSASTRVGSESSSAESSRSSFSDGGYNDLQICVDAARESSLQHNWGAETYNGGVSDRRRSDGGSRSERDRVRRQEASLQEKVKFAATRDAVGRHFDDGDHFMSDDEKFMRGGKFAHHVLLPYDFEEFWERSTSTTAVQGQEKRSGADFLTNTAADGRQQQQQRRGRADVMNISAPGKFARPAFSRSNFS